MEHTGHRERLRQRFDANQLNGFQDHEVLELLLTYAIPRIDVKPLAYRLLERFGTVWAVLEATPEELKQVKGMGERSAALLTMMLPLMKRYQQGKLLQKPRLVTYSELAAYCATLFIGCPDEKFYLLCFDTKMQLTKEVLISSGTAREVLVMPRIVVREAMRNNAVAVTITHNHPSGDPQPSQADADLTEALRNALEIADVRLMDHVVVGNTKVYSFHSHGTLPLFREEDRLMAAERNEVRKAGTAGKNVCCENVELLWDV